MNNLAKLLFPIHLEAFIDNLRLQWSPVAFISIRIRNQSSVNFCIFFSELKRADDMSSHLSDIQTTPVRGLDGCTAVISRVVWIESSCQINYRKFEFLSNIEEHWCESVHRQLCIRVGLET